MHAIPLGDPPEHINVYILESATFSKYHGFKILPPFRVPAVGLRLGRAEGGGVLGRALGGELGEGGPS